MLEFIIGLFIVSTAIVVLCHQAEKRRKQRDYFDKYFKDYSPPDPPSENTSANSTTGESKKTYGNEKFR